MRLSRVSLRVIITVVFFLVLGVGASSVAGAVEPTSGAVSARTTAVRAALVPVPRVNSFWTYTQPSFGGTAARALCNAGQVNDWNALGPVKSAQNNCEYRVWMEYAGGSPSPFCIDPHSDRTNIGSTYWFPSVIRIGTIVGDSC